MIAVINLKKTEHNFVLITNYDALCYYRDMFMDKSTKLFKDFIEEWFSENNREPLYRRISHSVSNFDNAKIMFLCEIYASKNSKNGDINILELAQANDSLMVDKLKHMLSVINRGDFIRVNKDGGYCPIKPDELKDYNIHFSVDLPYNPTEENESLDQIKNFIYTKTLTAPQLNITKPVLIIENSKLRDTLINKYFAYLNKYYKFNQNDCDIFNNFIITEKMYETDVFIKSFQNGLINGLHTLVFKTFGYYNHQFKMLSELLTQSKDLLPKNFTIITNYEKIKNMFEGSGLKVKVVVDNLEYFNYSY